MELRLAVMTVGTSVYVVSSDTGGTGKSHFVVYTKFTLAKQTTPVAQAVMDVPKSVSVDSFGDLSLDANHVRGDMFWTPPVSDAGIKTYETYLATDAAGGGGTRAGSITVGASVYAVSSDTGGTGKSHFVGCAKSTWAEQTTPAARALTDVSKSASVVSFGNLDLDANHVSGNVS